MTDYKEKNSIDRSREHLANERTFLAWIRTAIALMGFGFIIVKFTLFLTQLSLLFNTTTMPTKGFSSEIGVIIMAIGVLLTIFAYIKYRNNRRQIEQQFFTPSSSMSLIITLIVISGGIFLMFYLINHI